MMVELTLLRTAYCRAQRCWQSNNLKSCARICNTLTQALNESVGLEKYEYEVGQLKQLVWFLKIKCLADDYHINESFLTNEDDIEGEDQVRTFTATLTPAGSTSRRPDVSSTTGLVSRNNMAAGSRVDTRAQRTGMLTGRMPTRTSSRHSGHTITSYRPLTTGLTASQTAFSRSTRPLLKYSTNEFLSKPIYEYLYNAQNVTNICPDYRQCLEYLNLVNSSRRQRKSAQLDSKAQTNSGLLISLSGEQEECTKQKSLGAYWLLAFGVCYFHLRMHKQADEFLRASQSMNKKCLDAYLWLIKVYLRLNEPNRLLKTCEEASINSPNAILFNWKARVQSLRGDSLAAHVSLRESLQSCPTNIEALANVGYHSFYGDKLELALKCFQRIYQLSMNTGCGPARHGGPDGLLSSVSNDSSAELFNNMAVCNFHCGYYAKALPLFERAFLNSPNKETTSNIWYNISFLPLSLGARRLAIACLRLALKNDSQNEDATNNLGVLTYDSLINDPLHYRNRQEYWGLNSSKLTAGRESQLSNRTDQRRVEAQFDDAETYFCSPLARQQLDKSGAINQQPEMLFNMAVLKRKRGHMSESVKYCNLYLQVDENNYTIRKILSEINELISHDT